MKILRRTAWIPALMLVLAGCGNAGKGAANDSAADPDTVAAAEAMDEAAEAETGIEEQTQTEMLRELLSANGGEDEERLRKCCTEKALQQLRNAYEYDDFNGTQLAVWDINGVDFCDAQAMLVSLKRVGPDTYQATFKADTGDESGETSLMEYRLALENGQWKIDSYRKIN